MERLAGCSRSAICAYTEGHDWLGLSVDSTLGVGGGDCDEIRRGDSVGFNI